ncbi:MAG: hypothetical protein AAF583_16035 [Pseudomonadota bacterium]
MSVEGATLFDRSLERGHLTFPHIPGAHWLLRIPVALILFNQGMMKLPDMAGQAEANMIPLVLFALSAFAEVAGALALIVGGAIKSWNPDGWISLAGDVLTRLGGMAIAIVVAGVIFMFYSASLMTAMDHILLMTGGLFFLIRGNQT